MKFNVTVAMLGVALLLGGCGTAEIERSPKNGAVEDNGWKTLKKVSEREIIAELEQTVQESPARDKVVLAQTESEDYVGGLFGEPTKELEEDMAVQAIEGPVAIEALGNVYGQDGFRDEGVIFFENQRDGAEQSGIWIGVKDPDERIQELLDWLQPKVDAGEILAEPIYIFRSPHTEKELHELQDEVAQVLKEMEQKRGSYALSVNTITGDIEISHDFLKPEQQEELRQKFADHMIHFEQDGKLVAEPGESSIITPEKTFTDTPVTDGGFILSAGKGEIFVAGGNEGAVFYKFPEADKLKVGQRVKVEASGGIMESYPAQGAAKFVEVLPDYKPDGANLSESQAVVEALEKFDGKSKGDFMVIKDISFDEKELKWILEIMQNDEEVVMEVEDR